VTAVSFAQSGGGTAGQGAGASFRKALGLRVDAEQLHFEHQVGIRRNHGAGSARAIAEVRRNHQRAPAAHPHARDALVPPADDLACAERELERRALENLPLVFQRQQSKGLNAVYHVSFTGAESCQGTITIRDQTIDVTDGLAGTADVRITADTATWIKILRGEKNFLVAVLTRKVRVQGPKALLKSFVRCFPG